MTRDNANSRITLPASKMLPETAVFLIRHSEKEEKSGLEDSRRLLTAQGRECSLNMGKELKNIYTAPFYVSHSPIMRCRETAHLIAKGAGVVSVRECGRLEGYPDFAASREAKEKAIQKAGGKFRKIIDELGERGKYDGFPPPCPGTIQFCIFLMKSARNGINIYVSHDWVIQLTARFIGATTQLFSAERPRFLECLCLWQEGGNIKFFYRGKIGASNINFPLRKS